MPRLSVLNIDISKITSIFPLLALFLLVVEGLLGFWISKAEGSSERIATGLIMVFTLVPFLITAVIISQKRSGGVNGPEAEDLGKVKPAQEFATPEEIKAPEASRIGGPNGSYSIMKPPSDWTVREISMVEWIGEGFQIKDTTLTTALFGAAPEEKVLVLKSPRDISLIPSPGKTLIDKRKVPTALGTITPIRLSILSIERVQPPFFTERSLLHNVLAVAIQAANAVGIVGISTGALEGTQRKFVAVELRQSLENITVDGQPDRSVNVHITFIGIDRRRLGSPHIPYQPCMACRNQQQNYLM